MKITRHQELDEYKKAFETAMLVFESNKSFSKRGDLFSNRSNSTFVALGLLKSRRSLA